MFRFNEPFVTELLISESPYFKPEDFKKLDIIENNLESLVKKYGKESERVWELCRRLLWTYVAASAELIRTAHADDSKFFISKGIQMLDEKTGIKPARPEEGEFFRFGLIVNIACYNVMRRENASSVKSLLQVIELKPAVRTEYISTYCLEFAYYFLGVISYEQNSLDSSETYFRTFMLLLNSCQSYIKHKNQKKRLNHYLAKCYTYFFLGKIFIKKDEEKAYKYMEKSYLMSAKIDRLNIFVKQMIDQEYYKFKIRIDELKSNDLPNFKDRADVVNKKYLAKIGNDEPNFIKSSKDRIERLRRDGSLTMKLDSGTSLMNNAEQISLEPNLHTGKTHNGLNMIRIRSSMDRKVSMSNISRKDSHISEEPKEVSIDSNVIDVIQKIEDSTFEMRHKRTDKTGTHSNLDDEFEELLEKNEEKGSRNGGSSDILNNSVSFLEGSNKGSEQNTVEDFIKFHKKAKSMAVNKSSIPASGRQDSFSIIENVSPINEKSQLASANKPPQKKQLVPIGMSVLDLRRLEIQAAKMIQKNWKIHRVRPKKEPVQPVKIQNLIEIEKVVNDASDFTNKSKTNENKSQGAGEISQFGIPALDKDLSHSHDTSEINRFDHQLKPIPSILQKIDISGTELKRPPVTPISLGNESFGNLEDKRDENRMNIGTHSHNQGSGRKDFLIKSEMRVLLSELQASTEFEFGSPLKVPPQSNLIEEKEAEPIFEPDKEKKAVASQLTLEENAKKEKTASRGPEPKLELNMSILNKIDSENVLDSYPAKIDLANHNPEHAPKHHPTNVSHLNESHEKKHHKHKDPTKHLQFVSKRALSILTTAKPSIETEKHNTTPMSLSPKSASHQSSLSNNDHKDKKSGGESFGGIMKAMGHGRDFQEISVSTSNDNSLIGNRADAAQADGKSASVVTKPILRYGGRKGSAVSKSFKKGGGTGVSFTSVLRGPQPIEKAPVFEIEEDQDVIKLSFMPFRFFKTMQSQIFLWSVRFISKIYNKIHDSNFFRFEIRNRADISLQFQVPVAPELETKYEGATTIWPRLVDGFIQWFITENLEEAYRQYDKRVHAFVKEKILMSRRKSVVHTVGQGKVARIDQEALIEMKRRLCFLIDKKLFIQRRQNGSILLLARNMEDQVLREFLSDEMKSIDNFYTIQKNRLLGLTGNGQIVGELSPLASGRRSLSEKEQKKNHKKLIIQCVVFNKSWRLVQVFLDDAYKACLSNKDSVSIVVTSLKAIKNPPRKEFQISLRVFVENLRKYWFSSYTCFYYTKQLTMGPLIHFISNLEKVVVFNKDEVTLSSDYLQKESDAFDFSFPENRALYIHEAFGDNARNKKKKNVARRETDYLFDKNFNEVFDKYFSSKKEMVFDQNVGEENNALDDGNIKVDSDEENQAIDQPAVHAEEPSFVKDMKGKGGTERFLSSESSIGDQSLLKKRRYYLSYRIPNASVVYLRIELKKSSSFGLDNDYMIVSGYHPLKGHMYYKQITSQRMMERIKNIILAEKSEENKNFALTNLVKNELNLTGRAFSIKNINYDIQSIQKKNQLSLHPIFLKVALLKNSPCLLNAFKHYRFFFLHEISTVGRTYIEMNVYRWNLQTPTDHEIYLSFDIHPVETKTKQYKLILNDSDVYNFFGVQIRYEFNSHYLINVARTILSKFRFHRHYISKRLKIESNLTVYKEFDHKVYTLQNNLNPNNFDNNLKVSYYLEPKYYQPKIILQQVKRYQKAFFIFTIEYSQPFGFWNIKIYNPRSSRTFLATINFNNILSWHLRFYKKVYPAVMDELDVNEIRDYQHYTMKLKKLRAGNKQVISSARKKNVQLDLNEQNLTNEDQKTLHKMERMYGTPFLNHLGHEDETKRTHDSSRVKSSQRTGMESKFTTNEIVKKMDFHEIRFWQNVIDLCEFKADNRGNTCIKINNFNSELTEIVFAETVKIDKYTDTLIEMYFEKSGSNIDLFGIFDNISYLSSINYSLLIKIYYFRNLHNQFERMNLREIINLFIADGFYKYQANYFESKVNLADLYTICDYIVFKIKNSNLVNLMHETPLFSRKFIHDIGEESKQLDHNSNLMEDESAKGIFLTKEILSVNPPRAVMLWYKSKKGIIDVKIYSIADSSVIELNLKIQKLRRQIPMIEPMLANKMYKEVGRRILAHSRAFLKMNMGYRDRIKKDMDAFQRDYLVANAEQY